MKSLKTSSIDSGSILIELMIALFVFSISFTAFAALIFTRQNFVINSSLRREMIFSSVSKLENWRGLGTAPVEIKNQTACVKNIKSQTEKVYFEILVPDMEYSKAIDTDCGGAKYDFLKLGTELKDVYSHTLAEEGAAALDVLNQNVFVGTRGGAESKFLIYNFDDSIFQLISQIAQENNINDIDATHQTAYLAKDGPEKQFAVADISNIKNPKIISEVSLPDVAGSFPNALSVAYYNQKVYVGTHRTAGREFHIYDASKTAPAWLGSIELNHNINAIYIREPYAFLATSGNTDNLIIVDIRNPTSPKEISSLAFSGNEDSISLYGIGQTLYIGRKKSTKSDHPDFLVVDISNPNTPKVTAGFVFQKNITGIKVVGDNAYISASDKKSALLVVNIEDKSEIKILNELVVENLASGIDLENNSVFVLSSDALTKFNF